MSEPQRKPILGITSGKIALPIRALVYGPEGVGKTHFGAGCKDAIFMCEVSGTERVDVARLPEATHWRGAKPDKNGVCRDIVSLTELLRVSDHQYKALICDTVSWLEPLLFKYVCDTSPKTAKNIEQACGGFGKAYKEVDKEWESWTDQLDRLRKERGMHIILLAHAEIKSYNNPEGENYDRYVLQMHKGGAAILKGWCDAVLFAHQEVLASKKETSSDEAPKMYGVSNNKRFLFTERRPAWDAKNRYELPGKIPLSWKDFIQSVNLNDNQNVDQMIARTREQIGFISAELQTDTTAALERAGRDPEKIAMLLNWIQNNQEVK